MLGVAERGVKRALELGATEAEVYVSAGEATTISVVGGFATPKQSNDAGVAVRVAVGERLGHSGSSGHDEDVLDGVIGRALQAARQLPESTRFRGFAPPRATTRPPTAWPPGLDLDTARIAHTVEAAAERFRSARDVTYSGVTVHAFRNRFAVASSRGTRAWDQGGGEFVTVEARVERGGATTSSTDAAWAHGPVAQAVDVPALAQGAVERARSAMGAQKLSSAVDEVLLAPGPVSQLLHLFTPALSGRRAANKQSPLSGEAGAQVAAPAFSLRDEPHGPQGVFRHRVDHEGQPTGPLALVEGGRLAGMMHDHASAAAAGLPHSSGHGWRTGVTGGVGIRALNLVMATGDRSTAELVGDARRAVLVNEALMGSFTGNEVTGDFSLVAPFAFLVEDGRIRHALPPTTVGGNVHRMLRAVRAVGRETRSYASGTYAPLLAGGVSCAT